MMLHYSGPKEKPIPPTGGSCINRNAKPEDWSVEKTLVKFMTLERIEELIKRQMKICDKCVELFGLESELTKRQFATLGELTYLSTIL